ncbi:unnamed protein product [Somion occarium]|uniref:Uncharacterized protein n=1 Tax=Somion occarium TaxID=3059160 RepID=A0ABP1CVB1_9APHY
MISRSALNASGRRSSILLRKEVPSSSRLLLPTTTIRSRRLASTSTGNRLTSWAQSTSKVSRVFTGLILLGVASTAYGLYEFYQMFTMWPPEVRGDLRAGVKAKHQGDFVMSERYLRRALETAQQLPLERLSPDPHLKLSGIAIVLGEVLEKADHPQAAYEVYTSALSQLQNTQGLSGPERVRAAAIAFKLGEMAELYQQPPEEEEKWLVYTVEELLRVVRDYQGNIPHQPGGGGDERQLAALSELELPGWVTKHDLIAPLETLGAFYNRVGKQEYAVPLYLSALSILTPSRRNTVEARCQGAHIMNSLADSLTQEAPTPDRRKQAEVWIRKALAVIQEAKAAARADDANALQQCEHTLAAALFNLGSLREMAGDNEDAHKWYTASRKQSSSLKMREGVVEAGVALRRLDKLSKSSSEDSGVIDATNGKHVK